MKQLLSLFLLIRIKMWGIFLAFYAVRRTFGPKLK